MNDGGHCAFFWEKALLHGAWSRHEDAARWLLDHTPLARIMGAYEGDPESKGPRLAASLFDLCVRAIVPFAIVDAIVQSRLPTPVGDAVRPTTGPSATTDVVVSEERGPTHGDWWVSCCECPRGWLRPIAERDALRIAAWHWADLVEKAVLCEAWGVCFHEGTWNNVMGRTVLPYHVTGDAALTVVHSGLVLYVAKEPRSAMEWYRSETATMVRVPHPWHDDIHVYASTLYNPYSSEDGSAVQHDFDWRIIALVHGDDDFVVELF